MSSARSVETDLVEDLVDGRLRLVLAEAVEPGRVAQVLAPGHVLVEADRVGQVADPALDLARLPGRVEAHDGCLAVGRLGQPEQHQDRRRLARAVLPEQPEDLARVDLEVEPVDGRQRPVLLGQPARPDDRLGTIRVGGSGGVVSGLDGRGGRCRWCPGLAHRRPYRWKVHHRPIRTRAISPIPTMPHSNDVWIVTRMSAEAFATGAVALNVVT